MTLPSPWRADPRGCFSVAPGARDLLGSVFRLLSLAPPELAEQAPLSSMLRRSRAVWELATLSGFPSASINWWGTWPAQAEIGWTISDRAFGALLEGAVDRVTLKNSLTSYQDIAESEDYAWPLSTLLPGVLAHFDLPDCYRELRKKSLSLVDPWGPGAGSV